MRPFKVIQPNVIELDNVTFLHGDRHGILNLSLHMRAGTLCGIVGLPGSGKTTLVRLLMGVYRAQQGTVRVLGSDPLRFKVSVREKVAQVVEPEAMRSDVLVCEQLYLIASLYGIERSQASKRLRWILTLLNLGDVQHMRIGELSPVLIRRLGLACSLVQSPSVIVADEPCGNLALPERMRLWDCLRVLRNERRTLLVTTQHLQDASYCDLVGVLHEGRLLSVDTPAGLYRRAFGGDMLRVRAPAYWWQAVQRAVTGMPGVRATDSCESDPCTLIAHVDSAARRRPELVALLHDLTEEARCSVEEYRPPFEAVIRRIIGATGGQMLQAGA
jgi:ABC-2 type transport system ATP-binding protein